MSDLHEVLESFEHELRTQDNRSTSDPIFMVQELCRTYGLDTQWETAVAWIQSDYILTKEAPGEDPSFDELEAEYDKTGNEPEDWTRTGYVEEWRHVQPCLTEKGAEEYIRINGHNHRGKLRVYAESGWRNYEWQLLRRLLGGELRQALAAERERCAAVIAGVAKRYWDQGHVRESDGVTEALVEVRGMS